MITIVRDKVLMLGRVTAVVAVAGAVVLIGLLAVWPELGQPNGPSIRPLDWLGLVVALSVLLTWILAIWHWGTRFPPNGKKNRWGLLVLLGFVLGAAIYWFRGARGSGAAAPLGGSPVRKRG